MLGVHDNVDVKMFHGKFYYPLKKKCKFASNTSMKITTGFDISSVHFNKRNIGKPATSLNPSSVKRAKQKQTSSPFQLLAC